MFIEQHPASLVTGIALKRTAYALLIGVYSYRFRETEIDELRTARWSRIDVIYITIVAIIMDSSVIGRKIILVDMTHSLRRRCFVLWSW